MGAESCRTDFRPGASSHRAQSPSSVSSRLSAEQPHLVDANHVLHTVTHAALNNQSCSTMDCQRPRHDQLARVRPAPTRKPLPPFIFEAVKIRPSSKHKTRSHPHPAPLRCPLYRRYRRADMRWVGSGDGGGRAAASYTRQIEAMKPWSCDNAAGNEF